MRLVTILMLCPIAAFGVASVGSADVVVSIENVAVQPGQTAHIGVYFANNNANTAVTVSGFNLPIDINVDGLSALPTGFTYGTPVITNVLYPNTGFDMPQPQITLTNVDAILTGSGVNTSLTTTPVKVLDLVIQTSNSVPVGTVIPIDILVPNGVLGGLFNISRSPNVATTPSLSGPLLVGGSLSVVPEPAGWFLLLCASAMVVGFRVLTQRANTASVQANGNSSTNDARVSAE